MEFSIRITGLALKRFLMPEPLEPIAISALQNRCLDTLVLRRSPCLLNGEHGLRRRDSTRFHAYAGVNAASCAAGPLSLQYGESLRNWAMIGGTTSMTRSISSSVLYRERENRIVPCAAV